MEMTYFCGISANLSDPRPPCPLRMVRSLRNVYTIRRCGSSGTRRNGCRTSKTTASTSSMLGRSLPVRRSRLKMPAFDTMSSDSSLSDSSMESQYLSHTLRRKTSYVLSHSDEQRHMKRLSSSRRSRTNFRRLRSMKDEDILLTPDHPEASVRHIMRGVVRNGLKVVPPKTSVSLRIDADILEWFKAQGSGYQTRINAVLRAYRDAAGR